jgi:hypothetical protein
MVVMSAVLILKEYLSAESREDCKWSSSRKMVGVRQVMVTGGSLETFMEEFSRASLTLSPAPICSGWWDRM